MVVNIGEWRRKLCRPPIIVTLVVLLVGFQYLINVLVYQRTYFSSGFIRNSTDVLNLVRLNSTSTSRPALTVCPIIPPGLKGRATVNTQIAAWAYLEEQNSHLAAGGFFQPDGCRARHRVAIIIPYRDRESHLKIFLQNIHPFLQRQQIEYRIFVVEMTAEIKFNRALLMNVGYLEALKIHDFQCFIFHDVDLLPEDDRNLYTCPLLPRHMSVAIDTLKYKLPYAQIFGGVGALTRDHFQTLNGFSNIFFGWGGEDDDMYRRIIYSNLTVTRYAPKVARYKMLVHKKDTGNPERFSLLKTVRARQQSDGISSLKYTVVRHEDRRLFTWILVSVNMTEILQEEPIHMLAGNRNNRIKALQKLAKDSNTSANITDVKESVRKKLLEIHKGPKNPFNILKGRPAKTVDWIPAEFTGELPVNLTKFDIPSPEPPKQKVKKNVKTPPKQSKGGAIAKTISVKIVDTSLNKKIQRQKQQQIQQQQKRLEQLRQQQQQKQRLQQQQQKQQLEQQVTQQLVTEKVVGNRQRQEVQQQQQQHQEEPEQQNTLQQQQQNVQQQEQQQQQQQQQGVQQQHNVQHQQHQQYVQRQEPQDVPHHQQQNVQQQQQFVEQGPVSVTSQQYTEVRFASQPGGEVMPQHDVVLNSDQVDWASQQ